MHRKLYFSGNNIVLGLSPVPDIIVIFPPGRLRLIRYTGTEKDLSKKAEIAYFVIHKTMF